RIVVPEPGGVAGNAQCVQAVLLSSRGCGSESRQFQYYPGTFIQLPQREVHFLSFRSYRDFGTGTHVGLRYRVVLAQTAEHDRRLGGRCATAKASARGTTGSACARTASTRRTTSTRRAARTRRAASSS